MMVMSQKKGLLKEVEVKRESLTSTFSVRKSLLINPDVYIYISNEEETQLEVFFDDFTVEHVKSPVVQMDDYYPFGLTFNSYLRENATPNQYLNNGKEKHIFS